MARIRMLGKLPDSSLSHRMWLRLKKPQTVQVGLADQSVSHDEFDSATHLYQMSSLLNSHS